MNLQSCLRAVLACAPVVQPVARNVAFGPRYGLPPYHAPLARMFGSGSVAGPPAAYVPKGRDLQRFVVILAPLEVVDRGRIAGVIAVEVRIARELSAGILRSGVVSVCIPVQALPGPVVNSVHGQTWGCGRGEKQWPGQWPAPIWSENQVSIARQNAHVIAVLVERMLPSALSNNAHQGQFARMHVGIAVVRLVGVLLGVVGIHVIRHGPPVDHEVRRMIGLCRNSQTASRISRLAVSRGCNLRFCLPMNARIDLGELEQIFAVVAGVRVVIRRMR